jgi:hypothetical protein
LGRGCESQTMKKVESRHEGGWKVRRCWESNDSDDTSKLYVEKV